MPRARAAERTRMGTEEFEHKGRTAFLTFLEEAAEGEAAVEASREFTELVELVKTAALLKSGKAKGRITLAIDIAIDDKGTASIDYSVATKRPKRPATTGIMFVGTGGGLTAVHPRQMPIPGTERQRPRHVAREQAPRVVGRPAPVSAEQGSEEGSDS